MAELKPCPGAPEGWKLAPVEPTPEIMAGAALAVLRPASKADLELAQAAARIVLERATAVPPGLTADMLAASIATMAPAYRAMLAATPTPPNGDTERKRADAFVREFEEWVRQTGALPWGGSWMAEVSSIIKCAAMAASKGEKA